jgi:magnesium transporter
VPADSEAPTLSLLRYDEGALEEPPVERPAELRQRLLHRDGSRLWLDVQGLGDEALLLELGEVFGLHPLALEDAVNVPQRPSTQIYDRQQVILVRAIHPAIDAATTTFEQISVFVGVDWVLTIQERHGDYLDPVRTRLRRGGPRIRRGGADYLVYAILDAVIDSYYRPAEQLGELLEDLEHEVMGRPTKRTLARINEARKELLALRRVLWPMREMMGVLIRDESPFIGDAARVYLRDCYDHCVQLLDVVETYRELAGNLMSIYLSALGNRTNEVMKVLTIMASIFIPLTFLAGIYGMNFEHMPELAGRWSYPILLVVMTAIAIGLLGYFRRLGWIGGDGPPDDDRRGSR